MKKVLFYSLILGIVHLLNISASSAQNTIDVNNILLMKYSAASSDNSKGLLLGDKTSKAISIFGQPNSISNFESEMDEKIYKVYNYGNNKLYFSNDSLASFDLLQNTGMMVGTIGGDTFHLGEKYKTETKTPVLQPWQKNMGVPAGSTTTRTFHQFTVNRLNGSQSAGVFDGTKYRSISNYYLKRGNKSVDAFIQLLFNEGDELVRVIIQSN